MTSMEGEAAPEVELETATDPAPVEHEAPQDVGTIEETDSETSPAIEDDGLDELDFGFKKYRVDKELKKAVEDWRSATTKKEQTVAERAKALEDREAALRHQAQAVEEELVTRGQFHQLDTALKQYDNVDWMALQRADPIAFQEHQAYVQQLMRDRNKAISRFNELQTEKSQKAQQDLAKRIEETREFAKTLPGFSPERLAKVYQFATEQGVTEDFLRSNLSPTLYKFMHYAQIGHELANKTATAAPAPKPQPKPLAVVTGKSSPGAAKSLAEVAKSGDMEEYAKLRASGRVR